MPKRKKKMKKNAVKNKEDKKRTKVKQDE